MKKLSLIGLVGIFGPCLLWAAHSVSASPVFSEVTPLNDGYFSTPMDSDFWVTSLAPADVDADGDIDLAVLGYSVVYNVSATEALLVLRNDGIGPNGRWQFTPRPMDMGELYSGRSDLAWGDYDGDGDHDLLVGTEGMTRLYRNDAGLLSDSGLTLPGYLEDSSYSGAYDLRSITWADADNDGDLDVFLPTTDGDAFPAFDSVLMRNDGADGLGGWLFTEVRTGFDVGVNAQTSWIDDDNDGDLDLMVANVDPYYDTAYVRRYRNDPTGFVAVELLPVAIQYGLADWGDLNADGRTDMLVAGNLLDPDGNYRTAIRTHTAQSDGSYVQATLPNPDVPWLDIHSASWADFDSDGDVDLLATGSYVGDSEILGRSLIYANDGSGTLTALAVELPAPQSSIGSGGAFTWFDLDADGDLDYLVAGAYPVPDGNGLVEAKIQLFRNDTATTNAAPTSVQALVAQVDGDAVQMSWQAALDDHTATAALTYDLQLFRVDGVPVPPSRLPQPGELGSRTEWTVSDLPAGTYEWRVSAVDSAWHAGVATRGSFTVAAPGGLFSNGFE